jgi:AAA domain, putative AbiEii toxin, Type IV TA system
MPVESIHIQGLRGFQTEQTIVPTVPNGNPGSGLTVLIGPNNAGKSIVLEALRAMMSAGNSGRSFPDSTRNVLAGNKVRIRLCYGAGQAQILETIDSGGSETVWKHEGSFTPTPLLVIPSRRTFPVHFDKGIADRRQYQLQISGSGHRPTSQASFGHRLFRIQQNRSAFDTLLSRFLSPLPSWYIEQTSEKQYYLRIESSGGNHNSDGLGDGIVSLFIILDALYDSSPGELVAIDEPELSLHPAFQRKLLALLIEYSADRQIIIATHSPYFVEPKTFANGCLIVRSYLGVDGCRLSQLSASTAVRLARLMKDVNNPHAFGIDARESLFREDGVILFEGQEDVQLIGQVQDQAGVFLAGEPYGWGVGGADKMRLIAAMFQELGYKRVVGVLDANKESLIPELQKTFPDYLFLLLPADDIRTKPVRHIAAVHGLLDEKYRLREEYRSKTVELLNNINRYLA